MRAAELTLFYALVGVGCAAAVVAQARAQRALDALLVLLFWPLYGPFLLLGARGGAAGGGGRRGALEGLAAGPELMAELEGRVAAAERRLAEIDGMLARPELSEAEAERRERARAEAGDGVGEKLARGRLSAIRRLRELRQRYDRELEQVRELTLQLRLQGELVKLAGDPDGSTRELLAELTLRVECLDEIARAGLPADVH